MNVAEQAVPRGGLLDHRLEHEVAVGGVEGLAVREVDLVLAAAVLVRAADGQQAEVARVRVDLAEHAARVGQPADGVDAREGGRVRLVGVRVDEVELELGRDDGAQAALRQRVDRAPDGVARVGGVRRAVDLLDVAEAPGGRPLPRQLPGLRQVGDDVDVAEAVLEAGDDVVPEVDRHDRLGDGDAGLRLVVDLADRHLLAAADTVELGVEHLHELDAVRDEPVDDIRHCVPPLVTNGSAEDMPRRPDGGPDGAPPIVRGSGHHHPARRPVRRVLGAARRQPREGGTLRRPARGRRRRAGARHGGGAARACCSSTCPTGRGAAPASRSSPARR